MQNDRINGGKKEGCGCRNPGHQAYQLLRFAFIFLPIVAGLDKFANLLANWEIYLSPAYSLLAPNTTMMIVGIIEIIAGIGVFFRPQIFAYIIAVWLLLIIINLFALGAFYDIALRDFALLLAALALGRLSYEHCRCCRK